MPFNLHQGTYHSLLKYLSDFKFHEIGNHDALLIFIFPCLANCWHIHHCSTNICWMNSEIRLNLLFWLRDNRLRSSLLTPLVVPSMCHLDLNPVTSLSLWGKGSLPMVPLPASLQRPVSVAIVIFHDLLFQKHCEGASLYVEPSGAKWSQNKEHRESFHPFLCLQTGHVQAIQAEKNLFNLKSLQKLHKFFG